MIHLGDITKLNGAELPIVDIITGGSPCQDLSVAGARKGLSGDCSKLFLEQVRIVREMREHDRKANQRSGEFIRPRFMVWENVPGALSSNGGKDFQKVLTEIVRVVEECPDLPLPKRWTKAGLLYSEMGRWSVAWRVHDAQFWGVPQRRKRIALIADFGGLTAGEILFDRASLSGNFEPRKEERQEAAARTGRSFDCYDARGNGGGGDADPHGRPRITGDGLHGDCLKRHGRAVHERDGRENSDLEKSDTWT